MVNFNSLTNVSECEQLLNRASRERSSALSTKVSLENQVNSGTTQADSLPDQIANTEAAIAMAQANADAATDPDEQLQFQLEWSTLTSERIRLLLRQNETDGVKLANKQINLAKAEHKVLAYDEIIAALEARKAEIVAAGAAA